MQVNLSPEVSAALKERRPVVALESTLITHGLPQPVNLQVGRALEEIVRAAGAVPATEAILAGRICAGLTVYGLEEYTAQIAVAYQRQLTG